MLDDLWDLRDASTHVLQSRVCLCGRYVLWFAVQKVVLKSVAPEEAFKVMDVLDAPSTDIGSFFCVAVNTEPCREKSNLTFCKWWSRHHSRFQRKLLRSPLVRALFWGALIILVDVSDIFYFFLLGGGEGGVRGARRRGGRLFIENPRRGGGGVLQEGGGPRGQEGVCREFGEGGAKYFFSGPKFPPSYIASLKNGRSQATENDNTNFFLRLIRSRCHEFIQG